MRRAAANGSRDGGAQAAAAEARLKEARRRLEQGLSARSRQDVQNALREAEQLVGEQEEVESEVEGLERAGAARAGRVQKLAEQKDAMTSKVADFEKTLQQLADQTRRDERDASRKLDEAANSIRANQVKEKIRYSKGLLRGPESEYAKAFEEEIGSNLDAMRKKVAEAAGAMGNGAEAGRTRQSA